LELGVRKLEVGKAERRPRVYIFRQNETELTIATNKLRIMRVVSYKYNRILFLVRSCLKQLELATASVTLTLERSESKPQ